MGRDLYRLDLYRLLALKQFVRQDVTESFTQARVLIRTKIGCLSSPPEKEEFSYWSRKVL